MTRTIVGGLGGSLAMDLAYLVSSVRLDRHHPSDDVDEETEAIVSCVRRLAPHQPIAFVRERPRLTGRAIHYAFGCGFAALYRTLKPRVPAIGAAKGLVYGVAVWLLSDAALIPAAHLGREWFRYSREERAAALLSHLAFAVCVDAAAERRP